MNCTNSIGINHYIKKMSSFVLLLILGTVFVFSQTFEELYKTQTNFYSTTDYEKIMSRVDNDGKVWNILFFDLGVDSQGSAADYNMFKQISKSVTSQKVHFLVQTRNAKGNVARYKLYKGAISSLLDRKSLGTMEQSLTGFIQWAQKTYPAEKNVLIVRGLSSSHPSNICYDGFSGEALTLNDFKTALSNANVDLELLILDCAQSANLETAYAISTNARYLLSSQENLLPNPFDYEGLAKLLSADQSLSTFELGQSLIDSYADTFGADYTNLLNQKYELSLCDLNNVGDLFRTFTKAWDTLVQCTQNIDSLKKLVQTLESIEKNDLMDFAISCSDFLGDIGDEILSSIYSTVLYERHGYIFDNVCGLSFYYPKKTNKKQMDLYGDCFGCGPYLAFLESVMDFWRAPTWVKNSFGKKESGKVPCARSFVAEKSRMYPVSFVEKKLGRGKSVLTLDSGKESLLNLCFNALYMEEKSGAVIRINDCGTWKLGKNETYTAEFDGRTLCFDDKPLFLSGVESFDGFEIISSPVKIDGVDADLLIYSSGGYEILGAYKKSPMEGTVARYENLLKEGCSIDFMFPAQFGVDLNEKMFPFASTVYEGTEMIQKNFLPDGLYMGYFTLEDVFGNVSESMGINQKITNAQVEN